MQVLYKNIMGKEINRMAETLYNKMEQSPGFDIKKAVEKLGGKIEFVSMEQLGAGVDAKIDTTKLEEKIDFKIICAQQLSEEYTRFCIAHELGHLFLHMTEKDASGNIMIVQKSFDKNNSYVNMYEWEAEEFAACFLMPEQEFKVQIDKHKGDVEKIAKVFKVSPQSVIMRCKRLGLIN